jgi:glycosyltransferase involved in cell wall biosynthesis
MPRLLIVTTVESTIRAFLLPYADHYRSLGWQVDALASGVSNCAEYGSIFNRVWDIQWSRNPANLSGALSGLRRVREIVADGDYDIVHVHTPVAAFIVRAALRKRGSRPQVVYTAHGFHFHPAGTAWKNRMFIAIERLAGKWTDALVTINEEDYEAAKRLRILPCNQLYFMPGIGIDVKHYSKEAISDRQLDLLRQELQLEDPGCIFLEVAEFIPRKRHGDLLRAFCQLKRPATLLLAGPGPLQTEMRKLAERLGIARRVRFLGLRKDIPVLMRLADVVVLPSQQEGLPRAVMEAMAMGKPVIGSDIRGVRDLLRDGSGVLFPVGDVRALTLAMTNLAEDPQVCSDLGSAGQQVIRNYDIKLILLHHDKLYERLLICPDSVRMQK